MIPLDPRARAAMLALMELRPGQQVAQSFGGPRGRALAYWLFVPRAYEPAAPGWPCLLFLHGAGERGGDLDLVKRQGLPRLLEREPDFPFVVLSPQCPDGTWWTPHTRELAALLDHATATLSVDPARVSLTGLSMGGFGAWQLAAEEPERFAALVPICGGGDPRWAARLAGLAIWTFHGEEDRRVPLEQTLRMVSALEALGAPVRSTVYPGVGHDAWTRAYADPELREWLLAQHRPVRLPWQGARLR